MREKGSRRMEKRKGAEEMENEGKRGKAEKRRGEEREGRHNFTEFQGSDCVY